jgi:uncharacterized hydrophobic protein (TIGR00271 family)
VRDIYFVYGKECGELLKEVKESKFSSSLESVFIDDFLKKSSLTNEDHVIVSGTSDEIKSVLKKAHNEDFSISFLADKTQNMLRASFDIPSNVEDALKVAIESEPKSLDLLYSNGEVVLWSAVIGDAPPISYKSASYLNTPLKERYRLLVDAFKKLKDLKKSRVKIKTAKEQEINTVASGIVVIEHDNNTCASSLVKDYLSVNDGKLSALLVSPASIMDYIKYLYLALFKSSKKSLPDSVGFIKSESVSIESTPPLEVKVDGREFTSTPVEFTVVKEAVRFCASEKFWAKKCDNISEKETIKLDGLPITKESVEYAQEELPFFTHASEDRYRELFSSLREQGRVESTFITLMILSTTLATVGLFLNSASVVIGAMLLAPLMQPIVSGSMGVLRDDQNLLLSSFKTVGIGVLLVLLTSATIALILPFDNLTSEISARLRPSLLDLIVALASGVAAAYAKNNEKIIGSLAGVSIAVALVPPISTAGIGLGWMRFDIFYQAFLLFVTNFVGIIFAAGLTFLVLGYSPIKRAKKGLVYSLVVAIIVAIPLYFSFRSMVVDSKIRTTLERSDYTINSKRLKIENVMIEHRRELIVKCDLLTPKMLTHKQLENLKSKLQSDIDEEFVLEIVQRVKL